MEASHEQQLSLGSREQQSPIPFSINIAYSSTEGGTRESARYNVYACKTCKKTFTSFQALGGHRKVHKKPRYDRQVQEFQFKTNNKSISLKLNSINGMGNIYASSSSSSNNTSTTTTTNNNSNTNNNKTKVYGCSICGSKFTSGQALGGHMTFHHAPVETTSSTPMALQPDEEDEEPPRKKMNVSLDLDLNLPAA
ncbi:putative transcription factor C2H2 family [Medicago truncatula]|uniref:C2H2-type zinc finger protein n=1 Tax=Medicago truncatula TaxID=3880 RepID=A0A072VXX0_MEDTR|nr:zinc finger protein ZAT5 [Medicago truncatula]KEH42895.1 C2H2-type zinc finger protein [Medicago truncatula]RHN80494.1 putative transcription factor C2H2 family [Medicago truncatula]